MEVPQYQPEVPQRFESTHTVKIRSDNGKWVMDYPAVQRHPGEPLKWILDLKENDPDIKAYFQFPPHLLIDANTWDMIEYHTLDRGNPVLEAEIIQNRALKSTDPYYYAIFIDRAFVMGNNPLPEIIVGP